MYVHPKYPIFRRKNSLYHIAYFEGILLLERPGLITLILVIQLLRREENEDKHQTRYLRDPTLPRIRRSKYPIWSGFGSDGYLYDFTN